MESMWQTVFVWLLIAAAAVYLIHRWRRYRNAKGADCCRCGANESAPHFPDNSKKAK